MTDVRVGILGPLEVRDTAGRPIALAGARLRALLVRLAVAGGHAVSADRLAEDLWPAERPADAANALQALVSRLRQAAGRDLVEYVAGGYRLAVDPAQIDAVAFERLVGGARTALAGADPVRGAELLAEAAALWRGPALADVADAPFAAGPVARLEELRVTAAEDLIEARLALGHGAALVADTEELAASYPLRERLRGQLMRALYAAGRQADALGVYDETRRLLADRLGVDPSPELAALQLAILRGDPGLTGARAAAPVESEPPVAASPAAGTPAAGTPAAGPRVSGPPVAGSPVTGSQVPGLPVPGPPVSGPQVSGPQVSAHPVPGRVPITNLPAQLTSFVGREDELERVGKQLGEARLVTLTGPGGAGKTRLAVEAAARRALQLPDGAWFIPLAPVRDALDIPQAILTALGIPETARVAEAIETGRIMSVPPLDRLADALAAKRLILVLDNCEHVVDAVARLAARVLAEAPGVQILATSREPLGVTGETLCPVPSLPLPPDHADAQQALEYAAVRLFEDRAAAVRPGFAVDAATVGPVIRICQALDGIPLAIELAAARLRSLTLAQVAGRLDDRFRLLATGTRAAPERHQTLRAIVDWSWDLLDEAERTVLRRLSVFSGGATPDAAEHVCALGGERANVIDVVASLVDKSLVTATGDTEVRYRLLETVRAYAGERLAEAGEQDQVRAAHAGFFLDLAQTAEPRLRTAEQLRWLDRLTAEHDNFSATLRYAIDRRDAGLGLRLVANLMWFWILLDYDTEGGAWALAVRDIVGPSAPPGLADEYAICAFATAAGAATQKRSGDSPPMHPDGVALLQDALEQAASLVTKDSTHPMLTLAAPLAAMFHGDTATARRGLLALSEHPDPWVRAAGAAMGGHLAMNDGEVETAARQFELGYATFQAIGDRWGLIIALNGSAEVAMARGEPEEAVRALEEARRYAAEGKAANWGEMHLIPLGRARAAAGDLDAARADLQRGLRSAREIGESDDEISGYVELSELARRDGDLPQARRLLEQARALAEPRIERFDIRLVAMRTFSKLGCLAEQEGDWDAASCWHQKAVSLLAETGADFLPMPVGPVLASAVEGCAALAAARGEHARAAELLGLAHTLHGFRDGASFEVTRTTARVTAAIGADSFAAAYQRGRQLSRDDALALGSSDPAAAR